MGVLKPDMIVKAIVPIVMAGILGIYGLIVAVILLQKSKARIYIISFPLSVEFATLTVTIGFKLLSAGLCCGFSSLASGFAIGVVGDAGVRCYA